MAEFNLHVIGAGRSGTSLLQALIGAHSQFTMVSERLAVEFLMGRSAPNDHAAARMQKFVAACEAEAKSDPARWMGHKTTTEQIAWLPHSWADQEDRKALALGCNGYAEIEAFAKAISDKKILFIMRDGRSCVESKVRRTGQSFSEAAARWNYSVRVADALTNCPEFKIVRFEDLTLRPEQSLTATCDFLGISYEPEMLNGTNSETMRPDYRRNGLDASATHVPKIPPDAFVAIRENLIKTGYLQE